MIRPTNKGGGIVVLDKTDYVSEMHRILSDHDTYRELPHDPTFKFKQELITLVQKGFD